MTRFSSFSARTTVRAYLPAALPLAVALALGTAGCAGTDDGGPVYQESRQAPDLEVPPELSAPDSRDGYRVPDAPGERVSAREMQQPDTRQTGTPGGTGALAPRAGEVQVLPEDSDVQIWRDGDTRWLTVDTDPDDLWNRLAAFWDSQNLPLERNEPEVGIMETQWAEDRAGIPFSGSRGFIARTIGGLYDSNTRDRYRLRVEREEDGRTAVYITHRGAEEQPVGEERFLWVSRPSDPELEAEMLNRLRLFLLTGDPGEGGQRADESEVQRVPGARIENVGDELVLRFDSDADQVWRHLGTRLDRSGLLVDERDRRSGVHEVTYRPDSADEDEGGFFSRLFGRGDRRADTRYRIELSADNGQSLLRARNIDGEPLDEDDTRFLLERIEEGFRR
ncbi:outer membrane protein assembly factor BamC [Thioalkalivibrio sp. ALR17-21]|uniref:outer membrane protein assembly factor BamC n=1 Tax=Thioalkalivibrio sp. ALR17-21 TaxID=1269813 RepID=UPI0004034658|nr:outer membrane protein assembly factor BamC [Thioalkalivibrio sp. ALR17-21]